LVWLGETALADAAQMIDPQALREGAQTFPKTRLGGAGGPVHEL
jgi:hypothetical protein